MADETTPEIDEARAQALAELEKAKAETRAAMDAADARITQNADGTLIVRLIDPITLDGAELARLTVTRVKVRHARAVRGAEHELEAYAEQLITPPGALDELTCEADYFACVRAAERALGKFHAAGRAT